MELKLVNGKNLRFIICQNNATAIIFVGETSNVRTKNGELRLLSSSSPSNVGRRKYTYVRASCKLPEDLDIKDGEVLSISNRGESFRILVHPGVQVDYSADGNEYVPFNRIRGDFIEEGKHHLDIRELNLLWNWINLLLFQKNDRIRIFFLDYFLSLELKIIFYFPN